MSDSGFTHYVGERFDDIPLPFLSPVSPSYAAGLSATAMRTCFSPSGFKSRSSSFKDRFQWLMPWGDTFAGVATFTYS